MYMKNGALKNKVAFYDFSEIGKNVNNRFIAAFEEEFDDKMVGRVRYLNDQTVCAFSDKGLTFISVKCDTGHKCDLCSGRRRDPKYLLLG